MGLGGVLGSSCALGFGAPLGFGASLPTVVLLCFFLCGSFDWVLGGM